MASWDELFPELLGLVLTKLSYPDVVRFSAVCTAWRQTAKTYTPFSRLLLPILGDKTGFSTAGCACADCCVIVETHDTRFVASSKNMLVFQDNKIDTEIHLVNTFSGTKTCLPSLTMLYSIQMRSKEGFGWVHIFKAVVLVASEKKRKDNEQNLVVAVICQCYFGFKYMAYCHAGSWTLSEIIESPEDIVARERRLFVLSCSGFVRVWDFGQSGSEARPVRVTRFVPSEALPSHIWFLPWVNRYLVESMGEFLVVLRDSRVRFRVYKYFPGNEVQWEEVESLGDDKALFLGRNESALVLTRDLPMDCEGNSIYFANEFHTLVYSLARKNTTEFCVRDDEKEFVKKSVWMVRQK